MLLGMSQLFSGVVSVRRLTVVVLSMVSVLLAACGGSQGQKLASEQEAVFQAAVQPSDIAGFQQLGPIYAGGLPSREQLKRFAAKGVATVIDFRKPSEGLIQEQEALSALGVNYVNIPLGRELASPEAQEKFAQVFAAAKGEKVLLHCRSGNRVGMVWSLYQISNGVDAELAIEQGRAMGMKSGFEKAVRASITKE
ncbi:beta-lactamase hydrolase domain-containing protein [Pseudoteredinibacter isoporae]|uniref:beta-lactamase hydrolase domain-containing protein n=1 Tax=Pseudoteredinibacter isoporae TaxID=570281 RepID=UPI00310622DD